MEQPSIVLTTLNEEWNIRGCLGSVSRADEIVLVDSFRRDKSVEIAKACPGRAHRHEYRVSSRQVERTVEFATGSWVFKNDSTSPQVTNKLKTHPDTRVTWHNLIVSPLSHLLGIFISYTGYRNGFHGFVLALLDANVEGHIPPINNTQLNVVKHLS
jgi:hypothetical protein